MSIDLFFKIAFLVIFFSFAYVMRLYTKRAKTRAENTAVRLKMHNDYEVPLLLKLRQTFGVPFYVSLLVWIFAPRHMTWSAIGFPAWLRLLGLILGILAIGINVWSNKTMSQQLGENYNPALRLIKVPVLVKTGPYAKVRHPIYLAFLLMQISVLLLTSNWLIGLSGLAIIISVILIRIPEEERLLVEQFGDEYRIYCQHTGSMFPKSR